MSPGLDHVVKPLRSGLGPDTLIVDLDLSVRAFARVDKLGIKTLDQLTSVDPAVLLKIPGFGNKSLYHVASVLEDYLRTLSFSELAKYSRTVQYWWPYMSNPRAFLSPREVKIEVDDPKWTIQNLPLSNRALACLAAAAVNNLDDLAQRFPAEIRSFGPFGKKFLIELAHFLQEYFDSIGPMSSNLYPKTHEAWMRYAQKPLSGRSAVTDYPKRVREGTASLAELLRYFLAAQGSKKSEILVRRFGLTPGARPQTLAAIGRDIYLTRERIRQISSQSQKKFAKLVRRTRPDLVRSLLEYFSPVSVATISEVLDGIPELTCHGLFNDAACARMLIGELSPGVHPIDPPKCLWTSIPSVTPDFYAEVVRTAKSVLHGISLDLDTLAVKTSRRIRRYDECDIESVKKIIEKIPDVFILELSGEVTIVSPVSQNQPDRRKAFAYDYIKEQGVPIQISEIFEAMQETEPALLPESPTLQSAKQSIKSLIERDERFAWAGMSTFGLREWGYESGVTSIGAAAVHLLRTAGESLTFSELEGALSQLYKVKPSSIRAALKAEDGKRVAKDTEGKWFAVR